MEVLKLETWINEFSPDELVPDKVQEYLDFVVQAVERYDHNRYSEWHHVMPKCIDKNHTYDSQGVRINGRDHFLAHRMLVDCFCGKFKSRLSYALMRMNKQLLSRGEIITSDEYEEIRNLNRQAASEFMREYMIGNKRFQGHSHSDETKDKVRQAHKGKPLSEEHRRKLSDSHRGKPWTESQRRSREGMFVGENNPMYGKTLSDDHRRKLSESHKNPSEETRRKLSESHKNCIYHLICKKCGTEFTSRGARTQYCENCK